jgi:hypothetical protein
MSMHPTLTTTVYVIIAVVFVAVLTYMFLYTRGLRSKQATLDEKGRLPVTKEEGIALATQHKEKTGRTGTTSYEK